MYLDKLGIKIEVGDIVIVRRSSLDFGRVEALRKDAEILVKFFQVIGRPEQNIRVKLAPNWKISEGEPIKPYVTIKMDKFASKDFYNKLEKAILIEEL